MHQELGSYYHTQTQWSSLICLICCLLIKLYFRNSQPCCKIVTPTITWLKMKAKQTIKEERTSCSFVFKTLLNNNIFLQILKKNALPHSLPLFGFEMEEVTSHTLRSQKITHFKRNIQGCSPRKGENYYQLCQTWIYWWILGTFVCFTDLQGCFAYYCVHFCQK